MPEPRALPRRLVGLGAMIVQALRSSDVLWFAVTFIATLAVLGVLGWHLSTNRPRIEPGPDTPERDRFIGPRLTSPGVSASR